MYWLEVAFIKEIYLKYKWSPILQKCSFFILCTQWWDCRLMLQASHERMPGGSSWSCFLCGLPPVYWEACIPFIFFFFPTPVLLNTEPPSSHHPNSTFQPRDFIVPGVSPLPCRRAACWLLRGGADGNINSPQKSRMLSVYF